MKEEQLSEKKIYGLKFADDVAMGRYGRRFAKNARGL